MVEHLLNAGADKTARDDEWAATPLGWAKENKSERAIERFAALGITK